MRSPSLTVEELSSSGRKFLIRREPATLSFCDCCELRRPCLWAVVDNEEVWRMCEDCRKEEGLSI